jgi:TRAP-type C4-dicarboxylate transport system permease small subunit
METEALQIKKPQPAGRGWVLGIDTWLTRLAHWFSYFGALAMVFMAFIGVANILASKLFGESIANTNELIDYALIIVVYTAVAGVQFDMGLLRVDIFSRKFPQKVNWGVELVGNILGTVIYFFAGYQAVSLLVDHYSLKTMAAASVHSFVIWPFTVVYVVGTFFLALALLWSIVRMVALRKPAVQPAGPVAGDVVKEGAE